MKKFTINESEKKQILSLYYEDKKNYLEETWTQKKGNNSKVSGLEINVKVPSISFNLNLDEPWGTCNVKVNSSKFNFFTYNDYKGVLIEVELTENYDCTKGDSEIKGVAIKINLDQLLHNIQNRKTIDLPFEEDNVQFNIAFDSVEIGNDDLELVYYIDKVGEGKKTYLNVGVDGSVKFEEDEYSLLEIDLVSDLGNAPEQIDLGGVENQAEPEPEEPEAEEPEPELPHLSSPPSFEENPNRSNNYYIKQALKYLKEKTFSITEYGVVKRYQVDDIYQLRSNKRTIKVECTEQKKGSPRNKPVFPAIGGIKRIFIYECGKDTIRPETQYIFFKTVVNFQSTNEIDLIKEINTRVCGRINPNVEESNFISLIQKNILNENWQTNDRFEKVNHKLDWRPKKDGKNYITLYGSQNVEIESFDKNEKTIDVILTNLTPEQITKIQNDFLTQYAVDVENKKAKLRLKINPNKAINVFNEYPTLSDIFSSNQIAQGILELYKNNEGEYGFELYNDGSDFVIRVQSGGLENYGYFDFSSQDSTDTDDEYDLSYLVNKYFTIKEYGTPISYKIKKITEVGPKLEIEALPEHRKSTNDKLKFQKFNPTYFNFICNSNSSDTPKLRKLPGYANYETPILYKGLFYDICKELQESYCK